MIKTLDAIYLYAIIYTSAKHIARHKGSSKMTNLKATTGYKAPKYLVCDGNGDVLGKFIKKINAKRYAGKSWFIYQCVS